MRFLRSSTVARRLRVALFMLLGSLLLAGGAGVVGLIATDEALDDITVRQGPAFLINEQVRHDMAEVEAAQRSFLLTGDEAFLTTYRRVQASVVDAFAGVDDTIDRSDVELHDSFDRQATASEQWFDDFGDPVMAARQRSLTEATALADSGQADVLMASFHSANAATGADLVASITDASDRVDNLRDIAVVLVAVGLGIGILAAIHATWRTRRDVTAPLADLQATLRRIEGGDFEAHLEPRGVDEVQGVARALNATTAEAARLTAQQQSQLARLEQITAASRRIRSSLDLGEVLHTAAEAIGRTVEVDQVQIRALDDQGGDAGSGSWNAPAAPVLGSDAPLDMFDRRAFQQLRAGRTIEIDATRGVSPEGAAWLQQERITKAAVAPVLVAGRVVAAVGLHWLDQERTMTNVDTAMVDAICRELAIALGHARLYHSERQLVLKLRELDEAKTEFVSTVSHELRTPLTSIIGYVEMLREGEVDDEEDQDRILVVVQRNSERLLALIEDLLMLSRIESGRLEVTRAPLDIVDVVRDALSALVPQITDRSLRLVTRLDEQLPQMHGDAFQLERVVFNLVSNAAKFTPEGGQITVSLRRWDDQGVELVVDDTGIGISEAEQEKLFTRFFRSSQAQADAIPGTGLGLVIVKGIVDGHGGTIDATSRVGEGTSFVVRLPSTGERADDGPIDDEDDWPSVTSGVPRVTRDDRGVTAR